MHSSNNLARAMMHVFKHLKTHELLTASQVCFGWNMIALNKSLVSCINLQYSYKTYFNFLQYNLNLNFFSGKMFV